MSLRHKILQGPQPTLTSDRLILRPCSATDAPLVREYLDNRSIAGKFISIPCPYEDWAGDAFVSSISKAWSGRQRASFAIVPKDLDVMVGMAGLILDLDNDVGEITFWVGEEHQKKGYATEAVKRVVTFGFNDLELQCIYGMHFEENKASGKVLERVGLTFEGVSRKRLKRWGEYKDLCNYSITASEYHSS